MQTRKVRSCLILLTFSRFLHTEYGENPVTQS